MSKVVIKGDVSGTGTLTIAAPNTNSDVTFNLPTSGGTVMTTATSLDASQIPDGSITTAKLSATGTPSGSTFLRGDGSWQSPTGGGVTSLNGQTGAITNTSVDAIGSYIVSPYVAGATGTAAFTTSTGSTYAGSSLRYGFSNCKIRYTDPAVLGYNDFGGYIGGSSYGGGGTALSGTWRCVGRAGRGYDSAYAQYAWGTGLFVRVS